MTNLIQEKNVAIKAGVSDWKEAIRQVMQPLVEQGYAEPKYVEGIFDNTEQYGAYYVIAPDIAFPHARTDQGALGKQMSVLLLREPVQFSADSYPVRLLVGMTATDAESHLGALAKLSEILSDDVRVAQILSADSPAQLYGFFRGI